MATNTGTFKTRVQMKSDTETNWNKAGPKDGSSGFIPLLGELIVYTADDTHSYSRLKIGDGSTNVVSLPFVDAGTIDGNDLPDAYVVTYANKSDFPSPGTQNKLYIDLSTNIIYCFTPTSGYTQLSNYTHTAEKTTVSHITYWRTGFATTLTSDQGILKVTTGQPPSLNYESVSVVRNITKEAETE